MTQSAATDFDTSLVWFRRDLRLYDHAALYQALRKSKAVFCVFVFDKAILNGLPAEDRRVAFIHASLLELDAELRKAGSALIVLHDDAVSAIPRLASRLGARAVFANRDYEPGAKERDAQVTCALEAQGQQLISFKDQVIFETDEVLSLAGKPFSVFTPYKRAWLKKLLPEPGWHSDDLLSYPVDQHADRFARLPFSVTARVPSLDEIGFKTPVAIGTDFSAGMASATKSLDAFAARIAAYDHDRDFPAIDGTSRLSVHLRFGTLSIRAAVRRAVELMRTGEGANGAATWLSELIWREFFSMIMHHHPHVATQAFKPEYDRITWEGGETAERLFHAWCHGQTGYPLVDAAMLQLNRTGFMHNRLRMLTASFLVKDLGTDWRWGERYFAEKLIDFDLASNNGGWQWVASSGCDAQPYFRIFNPVTQSQRFDPDGTFIRRYLPALKKLDAREIHAPWLLSSSRLQDAGICLDRDYPAPLIDHAQARQRTLERYAVVKSSSPTPSVRLTYQSEG
ncbi:deoxyribodipyrimidine photo-lyase [Oxalobacteraceae bacterium R-40]|uniref:Deoxyribodipyrimidine photo-lyase n=1 Tax=Keguizhuia sedimenti TaxID=3064264 RepID=A0ABU1BQH2_9BURK|nr:deoxyribodipyrimidine photo-lyase [Oxalobacteraceae bacterium R-40]